MRQGEPVFVDSGAWIARALSPDPLHSQAREQWEQICTSCPPSTPPALRSVSDHEFGLHTRSIIILPCRVQVGGIAAASATEAIWATLACHKLTERFLSPIGQNGDPASPWRVFAGVSSVRELCKLDRWEAALL